MIAPPIPQDEAQRIEALRDLLILDTQPEERFDLVTAYCQSRFQVAAVLVSLVDADRQWFKSACGLDAQETPREVSFCAHAILGSGALVVADATQDARFCDNPLVVGPPYIQFYAGAPLITRSGHAVGTLCLIDPRPRNLEPEELAHLESLARAVSIELEGLAPTPTDSAAN